MSRSQQDQFIDEDEEEELCPLCVEELDITDKNFRPCPCGYQICQFCYNNIKTTMNGLCPACRRPYDEKSIQWKAISPEEMAQHRQNLAQKAKKNQQAKQKEIQKREADNLSRKHLAGLRVRQRNLVYVTGMKPKIQGDKLIEVLRGPQYFGQYGDIVKIVVATPSKPTQQSVGIYVTFARNEDAAMCIQTMNNHYNDGSVRAQYGTTKYCSAYLRGETCNNRSCMFLHEPGDENERYTRQDLSNLNASSMQQPPQVGTSRVSHPQPQPQPSMQDSVPVSTVNPDNDSAVSPTDTSALPASANWGNQARRASRANTASTASPMATSSTPAPTAPEPKDEIPQISELEEKKQDGNSEQSEAPAPSPEQPKTPTRPKKQRIPYLDDLWKKAFDPSITFKFSFAHINPQNREIIERMPPLWDPRAYARRREAKEREEDELRRRQEESTQSELRPGDTNPELEETAEGGGSLQLGGEPEERPDRAFPQSQQSAIQPPSQQGLGNPNFGFGQQLGLGDELSGLGGPSRGMTPQQMQQQQQQRVQQQELLLQQLKGPQSTSQHHFGASNHIRQNSRFSFNEPGSATTVKPTANSNLLKQQASLIGQTSHFNSLNQHQQLSNQFFSGVQGPPPGLKTTGTPPVSGGGMFGQGHGFTPGVSYGANNSRETDKWESYRGQRGAQVPDAGKQALPFLGQLRTVSEQSGQDQRTEWTTSGFTLDQPRRPTPTLPPGLPIPPGFEAPVGEPEHPQTGRDQRPFIPLGVPPTPTPTAKFQGTKLKDEQMAVPLGIVQRPQSPTPAEAAAQSKQTVKSTVSKVTPVVPAIPDQAPIPKKQAGKQTAPASISKKALDESRIPNVMEKKLPTTEPEPPIQEKEIKHKTGPEITKAQSMETDSANGKTEVKGKRPHLGKLDISKATPFAERDIPSSTGSPVPAIPDSVAKRTRASSLTSSISSRPDTPGAIAAGSPVRRSGTQPRTLRITGTPSAETPPPVSSTPTTAPSGKVPSRRPSVASLNAPGTPFSEHVDSISITSASASRANSPPPVVTNKKADKKSRRQKQKQVQAGSEAIPIKGPAGEQAPILARKKKTKKAGENTQAKRTANSTPQVSRPATPGATEKEGLAIKASVAKATEAMVKEDNLENDVGGATTSQQHLNTTELEAENLLPALSSTAGTDKDKEKEKALTAATILRALESTHQLALSTLSLLKPLTETRGRNWLVDQASSAAAAASTSSSGSNAGNLSFTAADLHNHLDQLAFEISRAEAELLKQGQALRKDKGDGRISGRNLVTSDGTRYSCLTKEEEDRVLEFTARLAATRGRPGRWRPHRSTSAKATLSTKARVEGEATAAAAAAAAARASSTTQGHQRQSENALPPILTSSNIEQLGNLYGQNQSGFSDFRPRGGAKDDVGIYVNCFVPPAEDCSSGTASQVKNAHLTAADFQRTHQYGYERESDAEAVLDRVERQFEAGVRAGTTEGLAREMLAATAAAAAGVDGVKGREGKMGVKEVEALLSEARRAAEGWEKKLNGLVKRNRKMVYGGRE